VRRLLRIVVNLITATSVLVLVAVATFRITCPKGSQQFVYTQRWDAKDTHAQSKEWSITRAPGGLVLGREISQMNSDFIPKLAKHVETGWKRFDWYKRPNASTVLPPIPFAYSKQLSGGKVTAFESQRASCPWWFALTLPALLPAAWLVETSVRRVQQVKRRRVGHCTVCGYDLRGSPDGCPECGTVPRKSAMTSAASDPVDRPPR